ncbi:unnamed protein product [Urochloa humidicola]
MALYADLDALRASAADVRIVTSDGQTIAAHSYVLASASPVLERMIDHAWRGASGCTIRILGVPSDAVLAFLHLLYASRAAAEDEVVAAHGPQLLALAHAYRVPWLKRAAEASMSARLSPDAAVDMLKLAGLCDAPRLRAACARVAAKDFPAVEASDGWRFARRHDPALELELLQLLEQRDQRRARWARERASREACGQLADAMDSLDRIFAADAPCSAAGSTGGKPCAKGGHVRAGPAAADAALRGMRAQDRAGRMRAVQALAAALPATRLRLRPIGGEGPGPALPRPALQPFRGEDAGGEGGQDMAAAGEEGDEGQGDGPVGRQRQAGAGGCGHVMGEVQ